MASKSRKRSKRRASLDPLDLVRRNFERGDFKQALKDARVCCRQETTPELRSLLEHVYMARAEQLSRQGLRDDSRRIVQELMDLGVTEPSVQAGLPELLLSVGMLDHLPEGHETLPDEDRDRLQVKIVDQAVLRPQDTPRGMPEVREDAQKIRIALEAVEQGNEPAAMAQLKDIPRQSLFADWKFFVRGLVAYYRHDESDMLANWDRLDENRAAVKIAVPLKCMAGIASPQQDSRLASKVCRLEKQATSHPVLGPLTKLQRFAVDHQWRQVLKTLQTAGGELRKLDADVYQRVVSWLCGLFIHEGQVRELERLARFAEPLPIDPHWNRARAAVRDHSDEWGAERYWQKYLRDLESVTVLPRSERDLARGMLHLYLAKDHIDDVENLRDCGCGADHSPEIEVAEAEIIEHFNQCLTLAPTYRVGYRRFAEFHTDSHRSEQAAEVMQRWLKHAPNDLEALLFLSRHYLDGDEPLKAREFAERARQLKPLDKTIDTLLWGSHVKASRRFARQGQFDQARDELAAADRLQPGRKNDYDMLARKAVLETKAGRPEAARAFLEQAQEVLAEPTALWLVLAIEGLRIGLPNDETWLYEKRWQDALKRRCRGETASQLCLLLNSHLQTPEPYEGCEQHVKILLKYVRRCSRVKWQAEELRNVCEFVSTAKDHNLLVKLLKRGLRSFPQSACLHWLAAKGEIAKGPVRCDRPRAFEHLQQAIRLGASSHDPRDKELVEMAKEAETFLLEHSPGHHEDDYDDEVDFFDEDDGHFDDVLDDLEGTPRIAVFRMIQELCQRVGLNPEAVMDELDRRRAARTRGSK